MTTRPPLRPERVRAIDWYDGPVTAVVREASGHWLGVLLSAQTAPRLRIFGLVATTAENTASIEELLSASPPTARKRTLRRFHIALAESEGPLVLLRGDDLSPGAALQQVEVDWATHRSHVTFSAEAAFERGRVEFWTAVFDDTLASDRARERFQLWCASQGFGLRVMGPSSDGWLMVFLPPPPGALVLEAWVGIETDGNDWQLRVTKHGGPHWLRTVPTEEEARRVAEAHLRAPRIPPRGDGWQLS